MEIKECLSPIDAAHVLRIYSTEKFLDILLRQILSQDSFTKDYLKHVINDVMPHLKQEIQLEAAAAFISKGFKPTPKPVFNQQVETHLTMMKDIYLKLEKVQFNLKDAENIQDYYIFKTLFSYIYEMTMYFEPNLLIAVMVLTNNILRPEFGDMRCTMSALRNSFQHKNEIIDMQTYELYSDEVKIALSKLTRKQIETKLRQTNNIFIFNLHNRSLGFLTAIEPRLLIKFCITCSNLIYNLATLNRYIVFSHELMLTLLSMYDLPVVAYLKYEDMEWCESTIPIIISKQHTRAFHEYLHNSYDTIEEYTDIT